MHYQKLNIFGRPLAVSEIIIYPKTNENPSKMSSFFPKRKNKGMLVLDDYTYIYKCNTKPVKWPEVDPPLITLGVIHVLFLLLENGS